MGVPLRLLFGSGANMYWLYCKHNADGHIFFFYHDDTRGGLGGRGGVFIFTITLNLLSYL